MKHFLILCLFLFTQIQTSLADSKSEMISKISDEIRAHSEAYSNLKDLTQLGHRLTGSSGYENAVRWAQKKLEAYGLKNVHLQPVTVPHWVRGNEEKAIVMGLNQPIDLKIAALGGSIGTGEKGIEAEVIEVHSLKQVEELGDKVRGKIVFYNRPMDGARKNRLQAYGDAGDQRNQGASHAAQYGAVAVLVRSLTPLPDDEHPHTGIVTYHQDYKIPAAALSTHAANVLSQHLKSHPSLRVKLTLSAHFLGSVQSYNVIGEIPGSTHPDEYVVLGAHLDSWDLGTGAHDDGAGIIHCLEVVRAYKKLGIPPHRTIRVVLFADEESTAHGAEVFADHVKKAKEKVVFAVESDLGGFAPRGFSFQYDDQIFENDKQAHLKEKFIPEWKKYLAPLHSSEMTFGESGVDIEYLIPTGTLAAGFIPDLEHYFDFHHTALDRIEAVNPKDLAKGAAAIASFVYLADEML